MITGILLSALTATGLVQQTDTIMDAEGASRFGLEAFQGQVVIRTWDRDAVRVVADHTDSHSVQFRRSGSTIYVEPETERGMGLAHAVDFQVTLPSRLDIDIEGLAIDVDIQGAEGQIEVSTVHGPIRVMGGRGQISLESVNGEVWLEGAQGNIDVSGVAGGITIRDCTGGIFAESVGGGISLERVSSSDVEVGSVGGTVRFDGEILDGGMYSFGTHGGQIWLTLPEGIDAQVDVVTLAGDIEVDYPGAPSEPARGDRIPGLNEKELSFELGTGSARIEVETFAGKVHIQKR
jgi:DUF4097 and DUF4098 domain-containing protein YvlB